MMSDQILTLRSVVAGYGAGDILKGVDLDVRKGTVTCLIGPNGAGKSTVLKCVSGLLRPRAGTVTFRGEELGKLSPRDRLLRGIVHVPQDRSLFPAMSVWDNLLCATRRCCFRMEVGDLHRLVVAAAGRS